MVIIKIGYTKHTEQQNYESTSTMSIVEYLLAHVHLLSFVFIYFLIIVSPTWNLIHMSN